MGFMEFQRNEEMTSRYLKQQKNHKKLLNVSLKILHTQKQNPTLTHINAAIKY